MGVFSFFLFFLSEKDITFFKNLFILIGGIPHPEHPSYLPTHPIHLDHPTAIALSTLSHASNLDWRLVSHIIYIFQCYSPKSSYPHPLPQNPKDCSIHLCLFSCLTYRVIVTLFLNSIYMH